MQCSDPMKSATLRVRRQVEFVARGLRSLAAARRTGDYVEVDAVVEDLRRKLDAAHLRRLAKVEIR
jgi:hypothetical protein